MDNTPHATYESVAQHEPDTFLWVFHPQNGSVTLRHDYDTEQNFGVDHHDLVHQHGEGQWHGYAYPIEGGFRIHTLNHEPVNDAFITRAVTKALSKLHTPEREPEPDLPVLTDVQKTHYGLPFSG